MAQQTDRVRGLVGTLGVKAPCLVATTANITLSGEQGIDGVAVISEDRVLVKNQSDTTTNGIYVCQSGTWVRAPDFDGLLDVVQGTIVNIASGTVNAKTAYQLTTASPVVGTSALVFAAWISPMVQTLVDGATVSWDVDLGMMGVLTLGGNRTLSAPTNLRNGEAYALVVKQDAVGGRTVTWNTIFKWPGGTVPTLSTAANAKDILSFLCADNVLHGVAQKAFS